jgi:hypothetical protein
MKLLVAIIWATRRSFTVIPEMAHALYRWVSKAGRISGADSMTALSHSSTVRMFLVASVATDLIVEFIISSKIPDQFKALHIAWVVSITLYLLGFAALTATRRHEIKDGTLFLRSPLGIEASIPINFVESMEVSHRLTKGYGFRSSPDNSQSAIFSLGNSTSAVINLNTAVKVRQEDGGELQASRFLVAFDDPSAARRTIMQFKKSNL